jgi:hypothetical protein
MMNPTRQVILSLILLTTFRKMFNLAVIAVLGCLATLAVQLVRALPPPPPPLPSPLRSTPRPLPTRLAAPHAPRSDTS